MEGGYSSMNVSTKFVQLLLTFVLTNCGFPFWLTIGENSSPLIKWFSPVSLPVLIAGLPVPGFFHYGFRCTLNENGDLNKEMQLKWNSLSENSGGDAAKRQNLHFASLHGLFILLPWSQRSETGCFEDWGGGGGGGMPRSFVLLGGGS